MLGLGLERMHRHSHRTEIYVSVTMCVLEYELSVITSSSVHALLVKNQKYNCSKRKGSFVETKQISQMHKILCFFEFIQLHMILELVVLHSILNP